MADYEYAAKTISAQEGAYDLAEETIKSKAEKKTERIRQYRKEASRLVSIANKRLRRLEDKGLTDSPAYQKWLEAGGEKFGIKGKTFNEVQSEVARLRNFIDSETSTIRGINRTLKEMASNTGIKYKNLSDLRQKAGQFFDLASKIEQYLRTVEDRASAIGYQKIWESINEYVQQNQIDLADSEQNIEELTHKITDAMNIYKEEEKYSVETDTGVEMEGWFKLDEDS